MPAGIDEYFLSSRAVGRLAAGLYTSCGALVAVTAMVLPDRPGTNRVGLELLALVALGFGAVQWVLPWDRWPRGATLWLVAPTLAVIAVHDYFVLADPLRYGLFYVMAFVWLGLSHPQGTPLRFAPLLAASYLTPLLIDGDRNRADLASLAYLLPLCVLAGETVAWAASSAVKARRELRTNEASFKRLFESNPHAMWVYDQATYQFLEVNQAAVERYGYSRDEFLGMTIFDIRPTEDHAALVRSLRGHRASLQESGVWRHRRRDGGTIDVEITSHQLTFGDRPAVLVAAQDVTERIGMERELRDRAIHDALTGLGNRVLLADRVAHALRRGTPGSLALLLLDLDGFKTINDSLGHSCGDQLLVAVAQRLLLAFGAADTVARLGGDEFVVLLEGITADDDAMNAAERIVRMLVAPFAIDDREVVVSASIGIAVSGPASTYEELLRNADTAMYRAKQDGSPALFEREMHVAAYQRLETLGELRRAVERGELAVEYQPIVSLRRANHVVGVEALVRWDHPTKGRIAPLDFIPLAEESDLIVELGRSVLTTACREIADWNRDRPADALHVSVNLSARQLADDRLVDDVAHVLDASGLAPSRLTLEITETVVMADAERSIAQLHELKKLGIHLAVDDFGTGYSSLAYLQRMPVDSLKIDKSFVDTVPHDIEGTVLVKAILRIAETLHLEAVAEGVDNPAQVESLTRFGCPLAQGYAFSKPRSFADLATYLAVQSHRVGEEAATPTRT